MLWIGLAERNVAARQTHARGGREGEDDVSPGAVGDARGLQEQAVGRIEQNGENLRGGQVAGEVHVGEGGDDDERRAEQGQDHPRADEETPFAGGTGALFCEPPFAPRTQDGDDGGHGSI